MSESRERGALHNGLCRYDHDILLRNRCRYGQYLFRGNASTPSSPTSPPRRRRQTTCAELTSQRNAVVFYIRYIFGTKARAVTHVTLTDVRYMFTVYFPSTIAVPITNPQWIMNDYDILREALDVGLHELHVDQEARAALSEPKGDGS